MSESRPDEEKSSRVQSNQQRVSMHGPPGEPVPQDELTAIIDLLRTGTSHDFKLYKPGTLKRRIVQRMAVAGIDTNDTGRYLEILRSDTRELDLLAKDLLINVTSFFRDPKTFDVLVEKIVPHLVHCQPSGHPLRIWIAGCSTGEEAYSLAMIFREQIAAVKRSITLQVFASDVDPDAVAIAREGLYPEAIEADISVERLACFFSKEGRYYRILPELRAVVIFAVQDVLTDPPFSRMDLISCRNLLIYLRPEAQAKVLSFFHFSLRAGGILLLGTSETADNTGGRFEMISKSERLYRHTGTVRPQKSGGSMTSSGDIYVPAKPELNQRPARQTVLADLCQRLVMETYTPAAVLINRSHECLYSMGPTDRYLRMAPGLPTHDVMAMIRPEIRAKLGSAIQLAGQEKARVVMASGQSAHSGCPGSFSIDVQPVQSEGEDLLLICFVDEPVQGRPIVLAPGLGGNLEATDGERWEPTRIIENPDKGQKAISEKALSVYEEYQPTHEELLASKEELQSLNEELTALNSQLHETLERQRTTSDDLQNVLYSTNVATIFLDTSLSIRFFTPATKSLFNVIPSDIGRPLVDLNSLSADAALLSDSQTVLQSHEPVEREVKTQDGVWFSRRILPYRTHDGGVEGVVITFTDITERKHISKALEDAKRQAELANVAKSRFLAAASHDLRQPLQTAALLQGLLAKAVEGEEAKKLVARLDETWVAMSSMLNTLLDINQIEAGTVRAELTDFPVSGLINPLRDEFTYHAQALGLALRAVPCGRSVRSDPRLLEQMIRNLLSNALKYTKTGKILMGCRWYPKTLSIEVWDTGVGIPGEELDAIFEEYHQLDNAARERSRGLGLGLSIVRRLAVLLNHSVSVHSYPGKGSVFAIKVALSLPDAVPQLESSRPDDTETAEDAQRAGTILVIEDDPEVRELLEQLLKDEGHLVATAPDGLTALDLVARGAVRPDLVLSDYNLPNGMDGLGLAAKLRERLHRQVPVIILTGDISTDTMHNTVLHNCVQLDKPVKLNELTQTIQHLLPKPRTLINVPVPHPAKTATSKEPPVIFIIDDDNHIREALRSVLEAGGHTVEDYATAEAFLEGFRSGRDSCLLVDAYLPGMSGLELLGQLKNVGYRLPAIMITGNSDVPMAVQAMKAGALDFIEKPVGSDELLACVKRAFEQSRDSDKLSAWRENAANHIAALTPRQRQIMKLVLAGYPSKNIAADLGISQRTVENHRASIMKKTGSKSLPALARLALAAASNSLDESIL